MRAGHDQSVTSTAEFADRAGDERRAPRVEVVDEKLHVEIAVGPIGGGEGVLDLGVERVGGRLDEHGDAQRARDAVAQRPIELEFARPFDDAFFLVRIDAAAAVQDSVDGGGRYAARLTQRPSPSSSSPSRGLTSAGLKKTLQKSRSLTISARVGLAQSTDREELADASPTLDALPAGVRLGVSPLSWANDVLEDLGADISLETCLGDAADVGYQGVELGRKFPRDAATLRPLLQRYGLALASGWHSGLLAERTVDAEMAAVADHAELLKALGASAWSTANAR